MDYRLSITMSNLGQNPANGERFLEAFQATHPEVGAVVSQNTETGTLTTTFTVEARDAQHAVDVARPIFADAATAADGITPDHTTPVGMTVEAVTADELAAA